VPRNSFAQLAPERRRQILDVAAEEFARSGFAATSYNKLLERLGLGKSSAYYYFENKRDLFLTVVVDCYASYFESLASLTVPSSVDEFWRNVLDASVLGFEFILRDPRASAILQCMQRDPALLSELVSDQVLSSGAAYYSEMLTLGQALGAVRADLPLEILIEAVGGLAVTFDQWFVKTISTGSSPDPRLAAERWTDLIRRMIEARI